MLAGGLGSSNPRGIRRVVLRRPSRDQHRYRPDVRGKPAVAPAAEAFKAEFPQFRDLLVAVIDAREPEEAEATASALAEALGRDPAHFLTVRRPDALPFFKQEGLLFLDPPELEKVLDRTIDAQPFIGELAKIPTLAGCSPPWAYWGQGWNKARQISRLTYPH